MRTFTGSLRLAADPDSRVRADIEIDADRLILRAGGDELGAWELTGIDIEPAPGGFRVQADGEDLILTTGDNPTFAELVGVGVPPAEQIGGNGASAASKGAESSRFRNLRTRSAASWADDETLRTPLAYAIAGSAIVLILAAALSWGELRLIGNDGVSWARVFVGLAGVGGAVGAYLGWREHRRLIGAGLAAGGGLLGLLVMYFYLRKAGIGLGFFLAMIAAVLLTTAAILGLTKWGAPKLERH